MTHDHEISLKSFIDSTWFRGLARLAMIAGAAGATGALGLLGVLLDRQAHFAETLAVLQDVQEDRAAADDVFKDDTRRRLKEADADLTTIQGTVVQVQGDVATMKGMLSEIRRQQVARLGESWSGQDTLDSTALP